jgi:hypothetical protein
MKLKGSTLIGPNMLKVEPGKSACVFIEVHLIHPDVIKLWLNDYWYKVQYEHRHMICTLYGCYDHLNNIKKKPILLPTQKKVATQK